MRIRFPVLVSLLVLLCDPAHAQVQEPAIAIESYTGERPAEATRIVSPVLDELEKHGFAVGPEAVGRAFEAKVSLPPSGPEGLPNDFGDQIERGHREWIAGKFEEAVAVLSPVVTTAHANASTFARNQDLRERLLKGLIALGLSQGRLGDRAGMRETFAEILRTFPGASVPRAYGPDAYALFEEVRKQVTTEGRGRMVIDPAGSDAVVFVNESFTNVGANVKGDLIPGIYRVFVQRGTRTSRIHRVRVEANKETTLKIDPSFDASVHSSPGWTGLLFRTAREHEKSETVYAAQLARGLGAHRVAVVGIDRARGRGVLVGALIDARTGRELRRATVALDPDPPAQRLRALARFLAGEESAEGIDVELAMGSNAASKETARDDRAPAQRHSARSQWKWIAGGAAVAALGTGVTLLVIDGRCSVPEPAAGIPCPKPYDTAPLGYVSLGAGAALGGLAAYLFVRSGRTAPTSHAFLLPTREGALAGFSTHF
jgi:hypothetical protein